MSANDAVIPLKRNGGADNRIIPFGNIPASADPETRSAPAPMHRFWRSGSELRLSGAPAS